MESYKHPLCKQRVHTCEILIGKNNCRCSTLLRNPVTDGDKDTNPARETMSRQQNNHPAAVQKKAPQAAWAVQRVEVEQVSAWWKTRAAACAVINEAAADSSWPVDQSTTGFSCWISLPTNMRDLCTLLLTLGAAVVPQRGRQEGGGGVIDRFRTEVKSRVERWQMTATQTFASKIETFRDSINAGRLSVLRCSDIFRAVFVIPESS